MADFSLNFADVDGISLNGQNVIKISDETNTLWENENYRVAAPVVSCTSNVVTMTCSTSSATIRYSTNGGSSWSTYSSAITISATTNYLAYATKSGMLDSTQVSYTATYVQPKLPKPSVALNNKTTFQVRVDATTNGYSGVTYYITVKAGDEPADPTTSKYDYKATGTGSNSAIYQYVNVNFPRTVKVMGVKSGYANSDVTKVYSAN